MVNYSLSHSLTELRKCRLDWIIQSLRKAIKRLPKHPSNNDRIAQIEKLERDLRNV